MTRAIICDNSKCLRIAFDVLLFREPRSAFPPLAALVPLGLLQVGIVQGLAVGGIAGGAGNAADAPCSARVERPGGIDAGGCRADAGAQNADMLHLDLSSCMIGPYVSASMIAGFEEERRADQDAGGPLPRLVPRDSDEVEWSVKVRHTRAGLARPTVKCVGAVRLCNAYVCARSCSDNLMRALSNRLLRRQ